MAKPVFLIGYMGCGKSTVGKKLANKLKYTFIDTDSAIENMTGKSVAAIFSEEGEAAFRLLENSVLKSLVLRSNTVISTGGGTPCFYDNIDLMNSRGLTIYIRMHPESLATRILESKTERPLLKRIPEADLPAYIQNHLNQRERFYNKAQHIVKGENLKIETLVELIIS